MILTNKRVCVEKRMLESVLIVLLKSPLMYTICHLHFGLKVQWQIHKKVGKKILTCDILFMIHYYM